MATTTVQQFDPGYNPGDSGPHAPPTDTLPPLSTAEVAYYENQKRMANQSYGRGIVDVNLQRGRLGVDQGFATDDINQRFGDIREQVPGSFNRRGLLNSGIFKNALTDLFTDKTSALDRLNVGFARQFQDLDITEQDLSTQLENALSSISGDQQLRRSVYAEIIKGLG